jgi:hypothetical protein
MPHSHEESFVETCVLNKFIKGCLPEGDGSFVIWANDCPIWRYQAFPWWGEAD